MFYGISLSELLLPTITIMGLITTLFHKEIAKLAKLNPTYLKVSILLMLLLLLPIMAIEIGIIKFAINFVLIIFSLYVLFIGFLVDRKYIYISAIFFLVLAAITNTTGFEDFAEYMAVLCYLLLVMGVTKDIFYEKLFKTN